MTTYSKVKLLDLSSESESDAALETEILLYSLSKRKKSFYRSNYMKKRKSHGEFCLTSEFSESAFTNYFRLNRLQFTEVHDMIQSSIYSEGCNAQEPIGTKEKLAVFLRYLASGDSYKSIAYSYRMGDRTVSKIVNQISAAIWEKMQPLYLPQPTTEMWKTIALEFDKKWQFPHCVGAVDGKHIVIKNRQKLDPPVYNYKQIFSVVLMASVDANYKFTTIDVGSVGRFSDGNIFSTSPLGKKMTYKTLHLPEPVSPTFEEHFSYVFVGDEVFPLTENSMRPYPRRSVMDNHENKVFNYRLSRARQCVECAFGILASRFRIFRSPFEIKVDSVIGVVKAACILHNYLRDLKDSDNNTNIDEKFDDMPKNQLLSLQRTNTRSASNAFTVRRKFTTYFNTVRKVSWQEDSVLKRKF